MRRRDETPGLLVACVIGLVGMSAGCASAPEASTTSPRTAHQVQALALAPPMAPAPMRREVAGRYELELLGTGELGGQRLDFELRREPDALAAECRAGLWDLEGSAEGGDDEPLAVSMMGLSDQDEAPVAMRLIASSVDLPSGDIEGTAIVEHGGVANTLHFIARRRAAGEAPRRLCGGLVYQHETHYQGPDQTEDITTRRFEGCVEVVGDPAEPPR